MRTYIRRISWWTWERVAAPIAWCVFAVLYSIILLAHL